VSNLSNVVEWDGNVLVGWIVTNGVPTKLTATREIIPAHAAGFNDAVNWEIDQHRGEIFEKLKPFLLQVNSGG
jgi:hypothetical protein